MTASTKLLLATRNPGKLSELRQMLSGLPVVITDLTAFPQAPEIAEVGHTFAENAKLKATGYACETRLLTLADDSGLEIDALGKEPGVYSARYLGESVSFAKRIQSLLERLDGVELDERTARFVCAIATADAGGNILDTAVEICEGWIAEQPRGSSGFGYDPIFVPDGYALTFGELDSTVKNVISHRARALTKVISFLQTLTASGSAD